MKILAILISNILHPLFMPVISMAFYLKFMFFLEVKTPFYKFILLVMLVCTILLPGMCIFLLKSSKAISSVHMPSKEERRWPLFFGTCCFFVAYMLIGYISPVKELNYITMAGIVTMTFCTIINFFYKLSIHMAAIGGVTGMLLAYAPHAQINMLYTILAMIFASGLVGFARLQLSAHSSGQVATGFIVGFGSQFILLSLLTANIFGRFHFSFF